MTSSTLEQGVASRQPTRGNERSEANNGESWLNANLQASIRGTREAYEQKTVFTSERGKNDRSLQGLGFPDAGELLGGFSEKSLETTKSSDRSGAVHLDQSLEKMKEAGWIKEKTDASGRPLRDANGKPVWEAGDSFKVGPARESFSENLNNLLNRSDLTAEQKADIVGSTQQLLECDAGKQRAGRERNGLPRDDSTIVDDWMRQQLAVSQLENLSNWRGADQGGSNRCNVDQVASAQYYLRPELAAQRTLNIIENGGWKIPAEQSSNGKSEFVPMGDALANMNTGLRQTEQYDIRVTGFRDSHNQGGTNLHSQLDQIALAKEYNQSRGLKYAVGKPTADNPTGETLTNADGSAVTDKHGKPVHSPNMDPADVADLAKMKVLGIADRVSVVADKSWENSHSTSNLTVVDQNDPAQLKRFADGIRSQGEKHYVIMGVYGGDRAIIDERGQADGDAGAHSGHAIGMAYNPDAVARDGKTRGRWIGNNTWGYKHDDMWDRHAVSDHGDLVISEVGRAMLMKRRVQ